MEYSTRINLPQYKRRRVWMAVWRVLVYLVINAVFYAAFAFSEYFRHAAISIVAEAVFAVISFRLMRLAEFFERSWDGVIVSAWFGRRKKPLPLLVIDTKRVYRDLCPGRGGKIPDRLYLFYGYICNQIHVVVRRNDDGKSYTYSYRDKTEDKAILRYFKEGEEVRHHRCMRYFERKNKSDVRRLLCVGCGQFNLSSAGQCVRCRLPLLK